MASLSYQEFRDLLKRKAYKDASSFAENQSLLYGDENEFWLTQQAVALITPNQKKMFPTKTPPHPDHRPRFYIFQKRHVSRSGQEQHL